MTLLLPAHAALLGEVRGLIDQAQQHVAQAANSALTLLYWHIGQRISVEILGSQRADYGAEILPTLSAKLEPVYGKQIVSTLSAQWLAAYDQNLRSLLKFMQRLLPAEPDPSVTDVTSPLLRRRDEASLPAKSMLCLHYEVGEVAATADGGVWFGRCQAVLRQF